MKTIEHILGIWFLLSIVTAIGWSRFFRAIGE